MPSRSPVGAGMTIGSETCSVDLKTKGMVLALDIVRFSRPLVKGEGETESLST
jgi:hypothetical protein